MIRYDRGRATCSACKIYFAGRRSHQDPKVRDVTERNVEKTRLLLGADTCRRCLKHRISSAWTADRRRASDNWKHPVPPGAALELVPRPGALSNGIVEGFNGKARVTTKKASGYRTCEALEVALYHTLGDLPEPELTHRFC